MQVSFITKHRTARCQFHSGIASLVETPQKNSPSPRSASNFATIAETDIIEFWRLYAQRIVEGVLIQWRQRHKQVNLKGLTPI